MCFFWPQNLDIWGQKSIFCFVIAIFVDGTNDHYTWGYNFPIEPPQKKFRFWARGHFFLAHPCFWPFLAIPTLEVYLPLILVQFQRNLGQPSGPSKKWPRRTTDPVRAGIRKVFFWPKMGFNPKNHPKFLKRLIFIWEKATFFFEQLFRSWPEHG